MMMNHCRRSDTHSHPFLDLSLSLFHSMSLSLFGHWWDMLVYLLIDADGEDIAVPQRFQTEDQAMIKFLYRLISLSGSIGVRQTDQFSAARMQLSRHLCTGGAVHDSGVDLRQLRVVCGQLAQHALCIFVKISFGRNKNQFCLNLN